MPTTTVRLTRETHLELRRIAQKEGQSIQALLERLVSDYRRRAMLEEGNRAYAALRRDPKGWEEELAERSDWEKTLSDGLKDDE